MTTAADQVRKKHQDNLDEINATAARWKMPDLDVGQTVLWYPDANSSREGHVADVTAVFDRAIECVSRTTSSVGQFRDSVRHIDDPSLILKPNLRPYGGWDYTDEWKKEQEGRATMESRLSALEATRPGGSPGDAALEDKLKVLQRRVSKLEKSAEATNGQTEVRE
jgi:hypothetical protein